MAPENVIAAGDEPVAQPIEMGIRLRGEDLQQAGPGSGHDQWVAVERPHLFDPAAGNGRHDVRRGADGPGRQPAAERLGQRDHIRQHAEAFGGAPGRHAQTGLDLIENQYHAVPASDAPDSLQIAGLGQDHAEVHHGRFHDHTGWRTPLGHQRLNPPLHGRGVVERHRHSQIDHCRWNALAVGKRRHVIDGADVLVGGPDRDHHVVMMTVVGTENLDDRLASGHRPGDSDRIHGRFRPRVDIAPLRQPEATDQFLTNDHRILGRHREVAAQAYPLTHRANNGRVRVPLHHRAETIVEVGILGSVDVPHQRAPPVRQVDRPGVAGLVGRRHPTGHRPQRPVVHRPGARGAFGQPTLLLPGEGSSALGDAGGRRVCPRLGYRPAHVPAPLPVARYGKRSPPRPPTRESTEHSSGENAGPAPRVPLRATVRLPPPEIRSCRSGPDKEDFVPGT